MTTADRHPAARDTVRACLDLAARGERRAPSDRFLNRAVDLIAGRVPEPADPAVRAAQARAATMLEYRDLLGDAAYEALLPAFETLRLALPDPVAAPARLAVVPDPTDTPEVRS